MPPADTCPQGTTSLASAPAVTPARWRILVVAVAVTALFFQLGARALNDPDEGRYAEIAREMLVSGDYLTPRFNGVVHLAKPPVTYWLAAASMKLFGVNEFAARLPAALAALGTLAAMYLLLRNAVGEAVALCSVLVLLTCTQFFVMARVITTDMLMTCWTCWSVWFLWRWYAPADRSWRKLVWFYVFLGLNLLTKGPVGVALTLLAVAGLRWRNNDMLLRQMHWGKGALVVLAIATPWFVALAVRDPSAWEYFLLREVVDRVAGDAHDRREVWWYFAPVLAGGMLPWTIFLIPATILLRGAGGRAGHLLRMLAVWAGGGFVLFTLSQSKLPSYTLPLCPPLAALVGATLMQIVTDKRLARGNRLVPAICSVALLSYAGSVVALTLWLRGKFDVDWTVMVPVFLVTALGLVACGVCAFLRRERAFACALGATALATLLGCVSVVPSMERNLGYKAGAKFLAAAIVQRDPTGEAAVVSYNVLMPAVPFYLQRTVIWYVSPRAGRNKSKPKSTLDRSSLEVRASVPPNTEALRGALAGSARVFWVAPTKNVPRIENELGLQLEVIEQVGTFAAAMSSSTNAVAASTAAPP